ncbi:amidohydrolase family protein [Pseudonocardia sp. MH-G8]|uniref:metal-dependent hydrolase family protein n=1 Tax=Pseudonocardia sp. MH-G8 TaxID=1854588 RepID=UPI00130463C5|nr:amidohydrolase family protein [Pseudonocardia sp. MH-G8]
MALVLRGGLVWDGDSEQRRRADVVCDGARITSVTAAGSVRPGEGDDVLDLDGATVLPGLLDGHVHLVWDGSRDPADVVERDGEQLTVLRAVEHARAHLRQGVTTVVDLGSNWDVAITVARGIDAGYVAGPRVLAAGRTVVMTGGHDPFWGNMCDGADAVVRGVREQVYAGAGLIKTAATGGVYGRAVGEEVGASELSRDELTALATEAHRRGVKVAAHALGEEGIRNAVLAGVDVIEHGVFLTEDIVAAMRERGTVLCPTLAVYRSIAGGAAPGYAVEKAAEVVRAHQRGLRMALDAGVPVVAGTDAGSPGMPHPSLRRELACLREAGLAPVDVLRAATSRAADAFGIDAGRVRVGAPADLLVVDGDPLADPLLATTPRCVVRGGAIVD